MEVTDRRHFNNILVCSEHQLKLLLFCCWPTAFQHPPDGHVSHCLVLWNRKGIRASKLSQQQKPKSSKDPPLDAVLPVRPSWRLRPLRGADVTGLCIFWGIFHTCRLADGETFVLAVHHNIWLPDKQLGECEVCLCACCKGRVSERLHSSGGEDAISLVYPAVCVCVCEREMVGTQKPNPNSSQQSSRQHRPLQLTHTHTHTHTHRVLQCTTVRNLLQF